MPKLRAHCLLALLLLLSCAAVTLFAAEPQWVEVKSPHFTVITDGGEARGREVAKRFEEMRGVFAALFLKDKVDTAVPIEIIAFRNTKEMKASSPVWNGKSVEVSGYFQAGQDRNFVALDLSAENRWTAVFHEYAHLLINSNLPPMPLWFDEGLADFYSTMEIDAKHVKLGTTPEYYGPFIADAQLWPVEKLFAVPHDSKEYNESGDRRSLLYAESWLVVHYLMEHKLLTGMDQYIQVLAQKGTIAEAIQKAFGMSSKNFDLALRDYVAGNRLSAWILPTPPELSNITMSARPLSAASAIAHVADLHLHMRDRQAEARAEFEKALVLDPKEPVAHRGLGYLLLTQGDMPRAAREFRLAAAADDKDPMVHYYAGTLALRSGNSSREEIATARAELERATQLNPAMAEAFGNLGQICAMQEDWPAATAAMRRAWQLSPREDRYVLELARYLAFQKDFASAETLLIKLQTSDQAVVAARAADALTLVRRMKALPADQIRVSGERFQVAAPASSVGPETPPPDAAGQSGQPSAPKLGRMGWMSGTLLSVDCSKPPIAVATVAGLRKTWKMYIADAGALSVKGGEKFNCAWKNRKIAVNYREGGPDKADAVMMSLELE